MFRFVEDIKKILENTRSILRYSFKDRQFQEHSFNRIEQQNRELMSLSREAIGRLVELAKGSISGSKDLAKRLEESNARNIALAAELAEFKATDAEEDARQLAAQDADIARDADAGVVELQALIDAHEAPAEEPAAEPEAPADVPVVDEPVVEAPADEVPAEDLGAGDPPVITPEVGTGTEVPEDGAASDEELR